MTNLVTIFGGSGFVGRYIAQRMAREGWRVRVAVRRPNEAMFVRPYGAVGQVEPVLCNIRDDGSVRAAITGADAVVNCVGILTESGANRFDAVQVQGAERVARIASEAGVTRLVHLSSIGANEEARSAYCRTKALGEKGINQQFADAVILRPSVIFGTEDKFFNKFARMTGMGPVLPIVGAATRFQPVYVDDVAQAAVAGILGNIKPGIYELGGPEVHTLKELITLMLEIIERRRLVINLPFWFGGIVAGMLDMAQAVSLGLMGNNMLTRDQVKSLRNNNVVSSDVPGFAELGISPVSMESVLPEYLWPYRPSGQYAAIKDSAKNLKA